MSPYINLAGNALGYAGQAMNEVTKVAQRDEVIANDATRTYLRNQDYSRRSAAATLRQRSLLADDKRKSMEAVQRGLQQSLNIGRELGVDTDYSGFQALDEELLSLSPEMYQQALTTTGFPENDTDASYPLAFNMRAKMVANLRAQRDTQGKAEAAQAFAVQAEHAGYSEEEVLEIQASSIEPGTTLAELQEDIAGAQKSAQERQKELIVIENGKVLAKQIAIQNPGVVSGDGRGAALYAGLITGTSTNPRKDAAVLRVIANEGEDVMDQIEADGVMLGMTMAQRQAFEANAERERAAGEREMRNADAMASGVESGLDPSVVWQSQGDGVDATTTGTPPQPSTAQSAQGTIDPATNPGAHKAFRGSAAQDDVERAFLKALEEAEVDITDEAAVDAFRDKWVTDRPRALASEAQANFDIRRGPGGL